MPIISPLQLELFIINISAIENSSTKSAQLPNIHLEPEPGQAVTVVHYLGYIRPYCEVERLLDQAAKKELPAE